MLELDHQLDLTSVALSAALMGLMLDKLLD